MQAVINKILLNYEFVHSNKKTTIVILHGWKDSLDSWLGVLNSIKNDFNVLVVDLPGFGNSMRPLETFGVYDYAKVVKDLLNHLGIKEYIVIGHSFGGRIASILASQDKKSLKLILVDSAGIEDRPYIYNTLLNFVSPLKSLLPKKSLLILRRLLESKDYKNSGDMKDIFLKVISENLTNDVKKINIPTYIIWGSKDAILDVSLTKKYKSLIKNSIVRIVWGAGHHPHKDKPEEFLFILKECLNAK